MHKNENAKKYEEGECNEMYGLPFLLEAWLVGHPESHVLNECDDRDGRIGDTGDDIKLEQQIRCVLLR